jgi:2,4-dienoyl-CoA reductase-like NADH-dependent reductase (Old Yellow Enzyme family)
MWRPPERIKHALPEGGWPSPAEATASQLFSPLEAGRLQLEERTWVPAMVPWRATAEGEVTPAVLQWYGRFARGRPGAIVVEATGIRDIPSGPLLRAGHDRFLDGLTHLVDEVQRESAGHTRLFVQLIDFLSLRKRPEPARFFERYLQVTDAHREALGLPEASEADVRAALAARPTEDWPALLTSRELESLERGERERVTDVELPHVRDLPSMLPELFATAARRAQQAGFDGVELHFAHAYTMASFLSATNTRSDGYGQTREGRVRLALEVLAAVRSAVGEDFVVGTRMLSEECIEGGSTVDDSAFFAQELCRGGLDFLSLSRGGKFDDAAQPKVGRAVYPYTGRSGYECMPTVHSDAQGPFGRNVEACATIRGALREAGLETPVVVAGGLNSFRQAEDLLRKGTADVVGAARQSMADPDWFTKMREGRGEEVRRCRFTNYCEALDQVHSEVTCQLWDRQDLDEPGILKSADGRRRLTAPD